MPWRPLPHIAFAVATYPFQPSSPRDLPLELGDELYIIEQGGQNGSWYRGYLVAPPSLLAGLTSVKGQTLEARVFSGIFPKCCVEIREELSNASSRCGRTNGPVGAAAEAKDPLSTDHADRSEANDVVHQTVGKGTLWKGVVPSSGPQSSPNTNVPGGTDQHSDTSSRKVKTTSRSSGLHVTPERLSPPSTQASKPAAPVPMLKVGDETLTSTAEPLVDEIASCLREWHSTNLHELLLNRQYGTLEKMSYLVSQLDLSRRQFLHDVLTSQERIEVREKAVWDLVKGNKMSSGDVIVRDPRQNGRLLTAADSAVELTRLQSSMSLLDSGHTSSGDALALHHLLLEIRSIMGALPENMIITFSLYLKAEDGSLMPLSETYSIDVPSSQAFSTLARSSKSKTLFTDLSASDIGEAGAVSNQQLWLVLRLHTPDMPRSAPSRLSRDGTLKDRRQSASTGPTQDPLRGGRRSLIKRRTTSEKVTASNEIGSFIPKTEEQSTNITDKTSTGTSSRTTIPSVTRTVAAGVLNIGQIMRAGGETEQTITIWTPAAVTGDEDINSPLSDDTINSILYSPTGTYVRFVRASCVVLQLFPQTAPNAESLIRMNPISMRMLTQSKKIGFSEAPKSSRSDIYLTLSEAVISPEAVLSHPLSGSVAIDSASPFLNLQLTLEVRDRNGRRIEDCIYPTSNSAGMTAWRTVVTEQGTSWNQTICLKVATHQVPGAHLVMSIADAPGFPFGLSWMPLWDQQAFIHDGHHSLIIHAYDKSTSSISNGNGAYLSLPWDATIRNAPSRHGSITRTIATLVLESHLCSTEYSQNQDLFRLINWKRLSSEELIQTLQKIVFVPEMEIIKLFSDVLDALFAIMVHKSGDMEYENLVFNDLVIVLGIVHDRRFNLGPSVDQYAETHFQEPDAAPCLIRNYTRLLSTASDDQHSRNLRAAFKVGRHILKFTIVARQQQKAMQEATNTTRVQYNFDQELKSIFESLGSLMRNDSADLVGSRTLVVQHFHTWLPELLATFSKSEVVKIALDFVDSCRHVKGKLILYKLVLIINYTLLNDLFLASDHRAVLEAHCVRWISPYWGTTHEVTQQWREQVRLCCSVVAELVKQPNPALYDFLPDIVASYCAIEAEERREKNSLSLLFPKSHPFSVKTTAKREIFDEALLELAALMSSIAQMPPPTANSMAGAQLSTYLLAMLDAQRSILACEAYSETWLSLNIYHHASILKALEHTANLLADLFLPAPELAERFDMELWKAFFMTLLKVVGSNALALETFPEQKRRAVWKIAGDVREQGANLLRLSWDRIGWETNYDDQRRYGPRKLGGYQVQYIPSLVLPIVELCLSVHEGLRRAAVEVLQTMVVSEWALSEDLGLIETEMIVSLDMIFKDKNINESITQKLFIGELLDLFEPIARLPGDPLWIALKELLTTIDELMELLIAAHSATMESSLHTLRLMDFMKDMQKEDIFVRYVHELAKDQEAARNSTEAGLALQLHADLYPWDLSKMLPAITNPSFPEQSAFDRKEALYFRIIQYLEDGRAWSHALVRYRELADHYEHTVFDFSKLARTQSAMGKVSEAIAKEERERPRYFRVHYRGLGFPTAVRDRQYIFEGTSSERTSAFIDRMQRLYPTAHIVQSSGGREHVEGQYLEVTHVNPHRDLQHVVHQRPRIAQSTRDYLLTSRPFQFAMASKRQRSDMNVKEQWVEKVVFTTADKFPTLLRKSEIISTEQIRLSPIETAIERTWRKTAELETLHKQAASGNDPNNNIITEAIFHLLDIQSTSDFCLAQYRQFLPEVAERDEDAVPNIEDEEKTDTNDVEVRRASSTLLSPLQVALQVALSDHASSIKRCLVLYTRPSLQATRRDLETRLESIYPQDMLLPPAPSRQEGGPAHERSLSFDSVSDDSGDEGRMSNGDMKSSVPERPAAATADGLPTKDLDPVRSRRSSEERLSRPHHFSFTSLENPTPSFIPERSVSHHNKNHDLGLGEIITAKTNVNGIVAVSSAAKVSVRAIPDQSTNSDEQLEPSGPTINEASAGYPAMARGNGDVEVIQDSIIRGTHPLENTLQQEQEERETTGKTLPSSLGADNSTSHFSLIHTPDHHKHTGAETDVVPPPAPSRADADGGSEYRSATSSSAAINDSGKVAVAKKRFSLLRGMGKRNSRNSVLEV